MAVLYLLKENGGKLTLENSTGVLILEASGIPGPAVDWQAGGAGHPTGRRRRRNETRALFDSIEHALEMALGLAEEPVAVSAETIIEEAVQPAWDEKRLRDAIGNLGEIRAISEEYGQRFDRLQTLFRDYEESQARERALQDDEETWFLLT